MRYKKLSHGHILNSQYLTVNECRHRGEKYREIEEQHLRNPWNQCLGDFKGRAYIRNHRWRELSGTSYHTYCESGRIKVSGVKAKNS